MADGVAKVEVAIAQGTLVGIDLYPVIVHTKGSKHHSPVVAAQVTVDGEETVGFQLEEYGIDELYYVVSL